MNESRGADVLWQQGSWRCRYVPSAERLSGGTLSLYMGSTLLAHADTESLDDMLRVALLWRETLTRPRAHRNVLHAPPIANMAGGRS